MKIISGREIEYKNWYDKNSNPYERRCFTYAECWAELMEDLITKDNLIRDIAKETSRIADTDGITGFMYGMAVSILSKCWIHGEELRIWHNLGTQINDEGKKANKGKGVLNPALLSIGE